MQSTLFWEDVSVGTPISPLTKHPTREQLVRYAGASGDFSRIHYDDAYARSHGFPQVIVHGMLKYAFLAQTLTDWIGPTGRVRKLRCSYRRIDVPGNTLICKGRVVKKYVESGEHCLDCEIWIENGAGEITTPGSATLVLASREEI